MSVTEYTQLALVTLAVMGACYLACVCAAHAIDALVDLVDPTH